MNRKRIIFLAVLLILLFAAVIVVFWMQNRGKTNYSATKIEAGYQVDFSWWTGADRHTLLLEKGDVLAVEWSLERGQIGVAIGKPDQKPIYAANDVSAKDTPETFFTVTVPEAGEYIIGVFGKNATANISIKQTGGR